MGICKFLPNFTSLRRNFAWKVVLDERLSLRGATVSVILVRCVLGGEDGKFERDQGSIDIDIQRNFSRFFWGEPNLLRKKCDYDQSLLVLVPVHKCQKQDSHP